MLSRSPKDSELLDSNLLQNPFDKNTPGEVDFEVTDDVYVFKPTVLKIMDFENFLSKVEEIAGRKMGVVKVIIPQDLQVSNSSYVTCRLTDKFTVWHLAMIDRTR